MSDYLMLYNKLTKKELLYTLIARDEMLKNCRDRFQAHKETDARTIQDQSDLIEELKAKLAQKDKQLEKLKSENHTLISDNAYQEADIFELNSRIEQLQKQLAENETKRKSLEEKVKFLIEEKEENFVDGQKYNELKQQFDESKEIQLLLETQLQDMERSKLSWENQYFTLYNTLKNYREVTENKHLLNEREWQDYCAYKQIEPQIKGCLDRERELKQQLHDLPKEIVEDIKNYKGCYFD